MVSKTYIMYIIFITMAGFGGFGIIRILQLWCLGRDFKHAAKTLNETEAANNLKEYLVQADANSANPFSNKHLKNTFEEYRKDCLHASDLDSASPYVDITNYFHPEYIESISYGTICDWIPGTMTGLGLLGTFLGLTLGIAGLDVKSTESLLSGINGLLTGMNTAFLTSIVGVIASLAFSFFHKISYGFSIQEMNQFLDLFQANNLDRADDRPENLILSYQRQQTEAMKTFADEIAVSISNCMVEILSPVTTKMERTIEDFALFASTQQKEGLEQIVNEFIRSMNSSLGGHFKELGDTIQQMCEWQKSSLTQMQKIVDEICGTSSEIERIQELSRQTVAEMKQFMQEVYEIHTSISHQAELTQKQIELANTINEKNSEYIDKIVRYEEQIAQLADSVKCEAEAASSAVDLLQEKCADQIKAFSEAAQAEMTTLSESTKILAEASHQHIQALSISAQDEIRMLSETSAQLADENKNQLEALVKASSDQMELLSKACSSIVENSQQQIAATVAAAEAQSETLMQTTNDFVDFVQQQNQIFTDAVKQEISGIANQASQTTAGLDRAAASIETAALLLDKNLDSVLTRTFNEFDTGLTEITQHLSGTITDVRDTTESVPHLIVQAQKQCDDTLKALADQTQKYTDTMQSLVEAAQNTLRSIEGGRK